MAAPPRTKNLKVEDVQDPETLTRNLNQFLGPTHQALSGGLTFGENLKAQWHETQPLYAEDDWVPIELEDSWRPVKAVKSPPVDAEVIAYWPLDGDTGAAAQEDVGGADLAVNVGTGSGPVLVEGQVDGAWQFADEAYLVGASTTSQKTDLLGEWTLSFIVHLDSLSANSVIIAHGAAGETEATNTLLYVRVLSATGCLQSRWEQGAGVNVVADDTTVLTAGTTYDVTIVKRLNGATYDVEFWIGDQLSSTTTGLTNATGGGTGQWYMAVDGTASSPIEHLNGWLDEVRVSSIARTADEIATEYRIRAGVPVVGDGISLPMIRKDDRGQVYMRGAAGLDETTPIFMGKVPVTYAPAYTTTLAANADNAHAALTVHMHGALEVLSGDIARGVSLDGLTWQAADRTPIPPACFPYDFKSKYPNRPKAVVLADWTEDSPTRQPRAALGIPDWEFVFKNNSEPYIRIHNVPGMIPGRKYRFTFLVVAG